MVDPVLRTNDRAAGRAAGRGETALDAEPARLILLDGVSGTGMEGRRTAEAPAVLKLLIDLSRPYAGEVPRPGGAVRLQVPRSAISARLGPLDRLSGLVVALDTGPGRLFAGYLTDYAASLPELPADQAGTGMDGVLDLLSGLVRPALTLSDQGAASRSDAVLTLVDRHIEARLGDPGLDATSIARALGLSRSSLYRCFAGRAGVAAAIREERLVWAHRRLADPDERHRTIEEIARGCGFRDYPNFTRAFRTRFGLSPRDCRRGSAVA